MGCTRIFFLGRLLGEYSRFLHICVKESLIQHPVCSAGYVGWDFDNSGTALYLHSQRSFDEEVL